MTATASECWQFLFYMASHQQVWRFHCQLQMLNEYNQIQALCPRNAHSGNKDPWIHREINNNNRRLSKTMDSSHRSHSTTMPTTRYEEYEIERHSPVSAVHCHAVNSHRAKLLYATAGRRCTTGSICRWLFICAERLLTRSNTLQM